jgi:hypothetical protein
MPLAHAKFFEEPREFTQDQIEELKTLGLLREDEPTEPEAPQPEQPAEPAPAPPADTEEQ